VLDRSHFILYNYGIFPSITHVSSYLPQPVSEATFLHQFNATKCTSTFAGRAIMPNNAFWPVSFLNPNPCLHICSTEKKAKKKDMFMVRYLAGLRGHVVVAPATFFIHKTTPHSACQACTVLHTLLCGIGYATVQHRIHHCVV